MGFITPGGQYYEGDQASPLDVAVPQRPDATYVWNGSAWVQDPSLIAPDVSGFIVELKVAMGGIVGSNGLAKAYPLFYPALQQGVFDDASNLVVDAKNTGVLTADQYAAFQSLSVKHHVPLTLP